MDKKYKLLIVAIALSGSELLCAGEMPAEKLNLLEVLNLAKEHNTEFAMAAADYRARQEQIPQARSKLLPRLELNAGVKLADQDTEYGGAVPFAGGRRNIKSENWNVQLTQPLYHKNDREAFNQAQYAVKQAELIYDIAKQNFIARIAQAYFDVSLASETVGFAEAERAASEEQVARAKRGFDLGAATITDVNEAQAGADLARSREIMAKNNLALAKEKFRKTTGAEPAQLAGLINSLPMIEPSPNDITHWVTKAQQHNLEVAAAALGLDIARLEVERRRGFAYPSLDFIARYGDRSDSDSDFGGGIESREASIALEAKVPLYAGGIVSSQVREMEATQQKTRYQLEEGRRQAELQVREAFLAVTSTLLQIKALEQAQLSSESSLRSVERGLELGLRTPADVLTARQQLFSAKRDLTASKHQYLASQLRLEAAVGDLNEEDIAKINQYLK